MINFGIGELYTTGISAAGTTQATATLLSSPINNVTTVASGSGVILPFVAPGYEILVFNSGANSVKVYPSTGSQLNVLGTNNGALLATNTSATYVYAGVAADSSSTPQWFVKQSA